MEPKDEKEPVKIYRCEITNKESININGCVGCGNVESVGVEYVPHGVIRNNEETAYINEKSSRGPVVESLKCSKRRKF